MLPTGPDVQVAAGVIASPAYTCPFGPQLPVFPPFPSIRENHSMSISEKTVDLESIRQRLDRLGVRL